MPRRPRLAAGELAYHVLNRRVGRLSLFEKSADYAAFEKILAEAHAATRLRIMAYCLMPNHPGFRSSDGLRGRLSACGVTVGQPIP